MFSSLQCIASDLGVEMIRDSNRDRINVGLIQEIPIVQITACQFMAIGCFFGALSVYLRDSHRHRPRTMQQTVQMLQSASAGSNNTASQSVRHKRQGINQLVGWQLLPRL